MKSRLIAGIGGKWMIAGAVTAVALASAGYFSLRPPQEPFGGGLICHSGKCCKICPADFAIRGGSLTIGTNAGPTTSAAGSASWPARAARRQLTRRIRGGICGGVAERLAC